MSTPLATPARSQIADDLLAAAELIRLHGFAPDRFHDRVTGCFCPIGAIHEAVTPGFWSLDAEQVYMDEVGKARAQTAVNALGHFLGAVGLIANYGARVIRWAEEPGRTAEQVIAALEAAATIEAAR